MKTNPLIGRTLATVQVSKDRHGIRFVFAEGDEVVAKCDADCCSETWVEHVEVPSLPGVVLSVEDIDMPASSPPGGKWRENPECVDFYGCKVTLTTGHLVIDYRNDSNGYYGGWLVWPDQSFYGGVHKQNALTPDGSDA